AEDGIRDFHVTGVQTCALPICLAGSLADSLAGATIQAGYTCLVCGEPFEAPRQHCGQQTSLTRGCRWVANDVVNLIGTTAGAARSEERRVGRGVSTWMNGDASE